MRDGDYYGKEAAMNLNKQTRRKLRLLEPTVSSTRLNAKTSGPCAVMPANEHVMLAVDDAYSLWTDGPRA